MIKTIHHIYSLNTVVVAYKFMQVSFLNNKVLNKLNNLKSFQRSVRTDNSFTHCTIYPGNNDKVFKVV